MNSKLLNHKLMTLCAWSGPTYTILTIVTCFIMAGYFPPMRGDLSAVEVTQYFLDDPLTIRIASLLLYFASVFWLIWSLAMAFLTRVEEGERPILFYLQVLFATFCSIDLFFMGYFWCVASFRPDLAAPHITQGWNDAAYIVALVSVPPFTIWCLALGYSILLDKSPEPKLPRWSGYLNLWTAFGWMMSCTILFFKVGPFSQTGIIGFWIPAFWFFGWCVCMSYLVIKAVAKEKKELRLYAEKSSESSSINSPAVTQ